MHRFLHPHRAVLLGLAVLAFTALSAVVSEVAVAKQKPCSQRVIDDWFDDGRVNTIYPLPCYPAAIKQLPPDLLIYGNAEEEIGRAWAFAKQGKPDPGGEVPASTTGPADTTKTTTTKTTTSKTTTTKTTATDDDPTATTSSDTTTTDTSGPSSVPIPLLVLGGLAVLLLAAGSAGYLRRRMSGDEDGDGSGTPPASV